MCRAVVELWKAVGWSSKSNFFARPKFRKVLVSALAAIVVSTSTTRPPSMSSNT